MIVIAYLFGLHLVHRTRERPMWFPRLSHQTVSDEPEKHQRGHSATVWLGFIGMAVVTGMAGWILMEAAKGIADHTGLSDTLVGGLLTALATSTLELVTTIAAIRIGFESALILGVYAIALVIVVVST